MSFRGLTCFVIISTSLSQSVTLITTEMTLLVATVYDALVDIYQTVITPSVQPAQMVTPLLDTLFIVVCDLKYLHWIGMGLTTRHYCPRSRSQFGLKILKF